MSNLKPKPIQEDSPEFDLEFDSNREYFATFEPEGLSITLDQFTPDVICTKCGIWKSEHSWEVCKEPNFTKDR